MLLPCSLRAVLACTVLVLCASLIAAEVAPKVGSTGSSSTTASSSPLKQLLDTVRATPTATLLLSAAAPLVAFLVYCLNCSSPPSMAVVPMGEKPQQTKAKQSSSTDTDIVIVGGGVCGASLGAALAARGHRVIVVEQSMEEPVRIVGELLQPSGVTLLREMGLGETLEGFDAQPVYGYAVFQDKEKLTLDYPKDANGNTHEGRAFHNGRFIMALRKALVKNGAELRQGSVTAMTEANGRVTGVTYRTKDGEIKNLTAAVTVVCDGLFSSFREKVVNNTFQTRSKFLGLVLENPAYGRPFGGNVILADPTPILLYPISKTEGRMLIDFPGDIPTDKDELKKFLLTYTINQLPKDLHESFKLAVEKEGNLKQMPNRQMTARPQHRKGCLTLGDAFNVRHPLTGGGMTVAFTDVSLIVKGFEGIKDFNDFASLDRIIFRHYDTRNAPVATINILADALYDVFGKKYADLRASCYDYMSQGGEKAAGPVRLLSGVSRSPLLLVYHFFSVALWGLYLHNFPIPTPWGLKRSFLMLRDANIIILPLLQVEYPGLVFSCVAALLRLIFWVPYKSYLFTPQKIKA